MYGYDHGIGAIRSGNLNTRELEEAFARAAQQEETIGISPQEAARRAALANRCLPVYNYQGLDLRPGEMSLAVVVDYATYKRDNPSAQPRMQCYDRMGTPVATREMTREEKEMWMDGDTVLREPKGSVPATGADGGDGVLGGLLGGNMGLVLLLAAAAALYFVMKGKE